MQSITLLTGAAGSGKSTVAQRVARRSPRSVVISVDQLREMTVSGLATPGQGWTEEADRQFRRARLSAIHMAQLAVRDGFDVIIDDVCVPAFFADHYATLFADSAVHRILLLPNRAALTARIKQRGGPWDEILVGLIPAIYDYLEPMPKDGWLVLDSSEWTIERTVDAVAAHLGFTDAAAARET